MENTKVAMSSVCFYEESHDVPKKMVRQNGKMKMQTAKKIAARYVHFDRVEMHHYAFTNGGDAVTVGTFNII